MSNHANGVYYEHFIKLLRLAKGHNETYLWNDVPSDLLIEHGVIKDNKGYRRRIDCGIDLVSKVDGKLYLIQCKYGYKKGLRMHDLTGYFMFMGNNRCCDGIVYHTTDRISINIDYWGDKEIHTYLKVKFDHEKTLDDNLIEYNASHNENILFEEKGEDNVVEEVDEVIVRHDLSIDNQLNILDVVNKICDVKENVRCQTFEYEKLKNKIYDKGCEYVMSTFENDELMIPYYYQIDAYKHTIRDFINETLLMLSLPCGTGKTFASWLVSLHFPNILIVSPLKAHSSQNLNNFKTFYNNYGVEKTYKLINSDKDGNTDIDTVNEYLDMENVVISTTYKSVLLFEKILTKNNFLIIVDEFHNISKNVINDDENVFHKILYGDENKKLLLSATPRLYEIDDNYCDLNTSFKMTYKLPFNIAIDQKFICDYDLYFPNFDNGSINSIDYDCNIECIDTNVIGKVDFINIGFQQLGFKKCIAYFENNIELMKFYNHYMEIKGDAWFSKINVYIITANTKLKDRVKILDEYSTTNNMSIILSIRILDECIDVPVCDCVYFTYMCSNKIKNIQRLSRSIRKNKLNVCKKSVILVWCNNEYNDISDLLESIKEYDINYGSKVKILNNNECLDGNDVDRKEKVNKNNLMMLERRVIGCTLFRFQRWGEKLELVKRYIDEYDTRPTIRDKNKDVEVLGRWLSAQQQNYKKCKEIMKNKHIRGQYEQFINDDLYKEYFESNEDLWVRRLCKCKEYFNEYSKRPSQKDKDKNVKILGAWLSAQQMHYKESKYIMSNKDIREQYEQFINDDLYKEYFESNKDLWLCNLEKCKIYINEHNKKPSRGDENKNVNFLGMWLKNQQTNYKESKKIMLNKDICEQYEQFMNNDLYKKYF